MIKSYTNGEWKEPGSLCQAVGIYKEDFHKIVSVGMLHHNPGFPFNRVDELNFL